MACNNCECDKENKWLHLLPILGLLGIIALSAFIANQIVGR